MKRRIAGAFSHRLISPRTFLVIVHCLPWSLGKLFYNNVAHAARLPSCLLGKKETIPFFFLFFPLKPGRVNNEQSPPFWAAQSGFRNIFKRSFLLLSRNRCRVIVSLSLSVPLKRNVTLLRRCNTILAYFCFLSLRKDTYFVINRRIREIQKNKEEGKVSLERFQ